MVRPLARPLIAALALAAVAAVPSSAQAAVSITSLQLQPSTTAAGGHPDVVVDAKFSEQPQSDDVKSLGVVLPQGLVANPSAADRCSQSDFAADSCPPGSKVGSAEISEVVTVGGIDMPSNAPGDVYSLDPQGSEVARVGVVIRPSAVVPLPKVFLQSGIFISPSTNYGVATTFDNLPRSAGGFDVRITEAKLTLNGTGAHGPLTVNPTDCRTATMTASVTSYDSPGTSTASASFTPTACDRLPFSPNLSGTIGGVGLTGPGRRPPLSISLSMDPGQANISSIKLMMPTILAPDISALGRACPTADFSAGNCPSSSRVGTAFVSSSGLPRLVGPILLVASDGPLPRLAVQLGGLVPISLFTDIGLENGGITNTTSGLPDLPLSSVQTNLDASPGLLKNQIDLCAPGAGTTLTGSITSHSGKTVNVSAPLVVNGCVAGSPTAVAKPLASLSMRFDRSGDGVLTGHFKAGRGLPPLMRAQLKLPPGLKGGRSGLKVSEARVLGRRSLLLRGRILDARLGKKGTKRVSLRWRGIKASRKIAALLPRQPRITFVIVFTDTSGRSTKVPVVVRPSISQR